MRGKPRDKRADQSPAPGQYDPSDHLIKDRVPQANINSASKRTDIVGKSQSLIGPG